MAGKKNGGIDLTKAYQEASIRLLDGVAKARAPSTEGIVLTVRKILNTLTFQLDGANAEALGAATEEGKRFSAERFRKRIAGMLNGRAFTGKDLERIGLSPESEAAKARIEAAEAKAFKDNRTYRATFLELRKELKSAQEGTYAAVNETLKELSRSGQNTVASAKKAIAEKLAEQGVFKVKFSNGASVDLGAYASMVARTARTESGNAANIALAKAHGTGLVECIGNAVTCPVCAQYQRRVYSIDGSDKRFPALYDGSDAPLRHGYQTIHPHCRCEFIPYFEELQTPEELARDVAESNRPYRDDRTFRQKRDYSEWQATNRRLRDEYNEYEAMKRTLGKDMPYETLAGFRRAKRVESENYQNARAGFLESLPPQEKAKRNRYSDSKQFAGYREAIGREAPETLDIFQDLKYNRPEEFRLLKGYKQAVENGDISPLVGMKVYRATAEKVKTKLVGTETVDGLKITNYSTHFLDRVIGQYAESEYEQRGKRRGVPLQDIVDALKRPKEIGAERINLKGERSVLYEGEHCKVSVNPDTGNLIQTNPRSKNDGFK